MVIQFKNIYILQCAGHGYYTSSMQNYPGFDNKSSNWQIVVHNRFWQTDRHCMPIRLRPKAKFNSHKVEWTNERKDGIVYYSLALCAPNKPPHQRVVNRSTFLFMPTKSLRGAHHCYTVIPSRGSLNPPSINATARPENLFSYPSLNLAGEMMNCQPGW